MNHKLPMLRLLSVLICLSLGCSLTSNLPGISSNPTQTPPSAASNQQPGMSPTDILYQEDFEGAPPQGWDLEPGWAVTMDGGNHVLAGQGHVWASQSRSFDGDVCESFRVKLLKGRLHIVVRLTEASRYFIGFDLNGSDLNKQYFPSDFRENLAGRNAPHEPGRWYQVEVVFEGNTLRLLVDGTPQWTYTDADPLAGGALAFESLDGSQSYVDNILVSPPSAQMAAAPVPTTAAGLVPATAAGPAPTTAAELPAEVKIGIVYPLTGRLADVNEWGPEGKPFWEAAEKDINQLPEATARGVHFKLIVRTSASTAEGARAAVQDLVENEGIQAIAGLPTSGELEGAIPYLTEHRIAAISSASTGPLPQLMQPDTVYRVMPTELYMARKLADLAMSVGYTKAATIYRTDGWGDRYGPEFTSRFEAKGYPTQQVSIVPTHPTVGDYATEVNELSRKVAELGADEHTVILLAVWEGEDLNILHHAAADPVLSRVRWFAALSGPSILSGQFGPPVIEFPDAREFAYSHELWSQENHPARNQLVDRLWKQATQQLGREPRFEHVYTYDAVQLMARAILLAGRLDGATIAARISDAAQSYQSATGVIRFDQYGDRSSGDLDYFGLYRAGGSYEYHYYAFFYDDPSGGHFEILSSPAVRKTEFCPEC